MMKQEKNAQSIMNEIYNNLKTLNSMTLTDSDAKSDSCLNLMSEISNTMNKIVTAISSK